MNYINSHTSSDISYLGRLYDTYLLLPGKDKSLFYLRSHINIGTYGVSLLDPMTK